MNIYLVNRYSKLKGPFDIIDSNRQHIIKVGDICLRDTEGGVDFLVVYNSNNIWSSCKLVGTGNNEILSEIGNTLLFSFDGLNRRKGIIPLIKQLVLCYREKVIIDFLNNAIDILEYRKDFWDGYLFPQFFADSQELIEIDKETVSKKQPNSIHYPSVFAEYLSSELLDLLNAKLSEGLGLKESYLVLREKNPKQFRTSLMKFLAENPNGSIYDLEQSLTENNATTDEESQIEPPTQVSETTHIESVVNDIQSFIFYDFDNKRFNQLLQQFHAGDKHAFDKIVKMNLKLVAIIADTYKDLGAELEDLIQEGSIGLIKAIKRFNPKRKVHFPLYAQWWIHRSIKESLIHLQTTIKFPYNQILLHKRIKQKIELFEQQNGYEPSSIEIDIDEEIEPKEIDYFIGLPNSLNEITTSFNEWDEYPSDNTADEVLMKESQSHLINSLIERLKKRDAFILKHLYGIGEKSLSLSDIGIRLGLTRERVRQISEKAIRILRGALTLHNNSYSEGKIPAKRGRNVRSNSVSGSFNPSIKEQTEYQDETASRPSTNISESESDKSIEFIENIGLQHSHVDIIPFNQTTEDDIVNEPDESNNAIQDDSNPELDETYIDDLQIEHVYIDIPSAEPYQDIEIEQTVNSIQEDEKKHIDTNKLKTVFEKKASSYKYFWMISIISLAKEKQQLSLSFKEITIRMAALAWPIIFEDEIDLGKTDMMKKYLEEVHKKTFIIKQATSKVVESSLYQHYSSKGIDRILAPLMKNVPYRFLSPWIRYTTDEDVIRLSCSDEFDGLYALHSNYIVIDEIWWEYIDTHYSEICNFIKLSFLEYVKKYNSNLRLLRLMTTRTIL